MIGSGDTHQAALENHDRNLDAFLARARQRGLTLNPEKTRLRLTQVKFVGHTLTTEGVAADPEKIRAITGMPTPQNVHDLRRVLGMINYLAKFLPRLSEVSENLRLLDRKGTEWHWTDSHEESWKEIKKLVTSTPVLAYFDSKKEVTLQCDASQSGLGAAMLQEGKPVYYVSRALTQAEKNYAQIEKELLAIVFACERLDHYLYARRIKVESDHKPLVPISRRPIANAPKRLQRMFTRLARYDLDIQYKKGEQMYVADTLSRAYLETPEDTASWQTETCMNLEEVDLEEDFPLETDKLKRVRQATGQDAELQSVTMMLQHGWPEKKAVVPHLAKPYYSQKDAMFLKNGLVYKGDRIVVPVCLRAEMMQLLHSTHLGIEGCLRRARESFYWPRMNAQIRENISTCSVCNAIQPEQCREPLKPSEVAKGPWQKIGVDLFHLDSVDYLIAVDYYSNYFEVDRLSDTVASTVIHKMKAHMARHGIPDVMVSDNGPQFANSEFVRFAKDWGFQHVTSSPRYPQSNGKAENAVKTCKTLMKKALLAKSDIYLALMDFRNTPSEKLGSSPAQLLFGRRIQTRLPVTKAMLQPAIAPPQLVTQKIADAKVQQKQRYDTKSKALQPLQTGDTVRIKRPGEAEWSQGVCMKRLSARSYVVKSGKRPYRRNRRQIRLTHEKEREEEEQIDIEPPDVEAPTAETQSEPDPDPDPDPDPTTDTQSTQPSDLSPTRAEESSSSSSGSTAVQVTRSGRTSRPPSYLAEYDMSRK